MIGNTLSTAPRALHPLTPTLCPKAAAGEKNRSWTSRVHVNGELFLSAATIFASILATILYVWFACPLDLAPDEAHYWDWSRHLDWSYYSKGPLVAWLIRASCELLGGLSLELTGSLAAAVRLPAALCHGATLAAWYLLAAGVFRSPPFGLAVVLMAAALPVVRIGASIMTIDPPFLACWSWALVCVWRAVEREQVGWWIGAGIAIAIGVLAKYSMLLLPAAVGGYCLVHRRIEFRRVGLWCTILGAALGCLPILVWNARHEWVSFRHVSSQVGGGGGSVRWLGPIQFLGSQAGMMFGLWLLAFLAAGWRYRPTREMASGVRLLWWCTAPVWCVFALASLVKSGQTNWPAPAYVAGFVLAAAWVREQLSRQNRRILAWCLGVNTALGLLVAVGVHFPGPFQPLVARLVGRPSAADPTPIRRLDITSRLHGWRSLAAEVDGLRERIVAETGAEPVLAATYWSVPGQLAFFCTGNPAVYSIGIPNGSDRHSQYDFWRPNPVTDAQVFRGQSFVIVGEIGPGVVSAFERVEPSIRVTYSENGIPLQVWTIRVCHGFRGFDPASGREAGY
jgi:hypothetical protein